MIQAPPNPWEKLTLQEPFVLPEDKEAITEHNQKYKGTNYEIRLDVMPAPFVGDVLNSEIVILMLNPKFTEFGKQKENEYFRQECLKIFTHNASDYPFFCLNPSDEMGVGREYWKSKLKELIVYYDNSEIITSKKVSNIQFNPYSSVKFNFRKILPSQEYSFYLVRKAIERKAIIIIARKKEKWLNNVPELKGYNYFELNSKLNPIISKKNCPALFNQLYNLPSMPSKNTTLQNYVVYPIKKSKDSYDSTPVLNGGRSFKNVKLEISGNVAILKSKIDEIEGVFSLNKFFVLNDYS